LVEKHGIAVSTFGQILAYNTKAFPPGKAPTSWADYWDVERFPGKRGMLDEPRYNFEFAMFAGGANVGNVYPIDMDKAFATLDKIKPHIHVWWKQWPQVPILLSSRELVMSPTSNTRNRRRPEDRGRTGRDHVEELADDRRLTCRCRAARRTRRTP